MLHRSLCCLFVALILPCCSGQLDGTKTVTETSSDGTQTGSATLSTSGTSGRVSSSSADTHSASSSVSLTVTGGGSSRASFSSTGDDQSVQGSLSSEPENSPSAPSKATDIEEGNEQEPTESPESVQPDTTPSQTPSTDKEHHPAHAQETLAPGLPTRPSGSHSFAVTSLIPGDTTGDNSNRICVTNESEFKKYLAEGFEVTLIRKASGGNVEILREIKSSTGRSRSKIVSSTIPQDVKDLCGVTEETFGIKQRGTSYSFSSSSSASSTPSTFSTATDGGRQGISSSHGSSFEYFCSSDHIEHIPALKAACESFKAKQKTHHDSSNDYDIKHEYG